jgi:hypothetical protein
MDNSEYLTVRGYKEMMYSILKIFVGRDISVGRANCYRLDGHAIESRWGLDFACPFKRAMVPTQFAVVSKADGAWC